MEDEGESESNAGGHIPVLGAVRDQIVECGSGSGRQLQPGSRGGVTPWTPEQWFESFSFLVRVPDVLPRPACWMAPCCGACMRTSHAMRHVPCAHSCRAPMRAHVHACIPTPCHAHGCSCWRLACPLDAFARAHFQGHIYKGTGIQLFANVILKSLVHLHSPA